MAVGKFITFEGGEGAGKSTQASTLAERLNESGHETLLTREPGGSLKAEQIREFLLSGGARDFGPLGEALLFCAARDDHLEKRIRPALKAGRWVICDRFSDSTRAYQGAAGGVKPTHLATLERIVVGETRPDLTIILDLPAREGLARISSRDEGSSDGDEDEKAPESGPDHFERRDLSFHEALRNGFLEIAREEPERCVILDGKQPESAVAEDVWEAVVARLQP